MTGPQLPGVFSALAPILNNYGYLAVGGLVFVEDFGVPSPGETVLIAAALYAGAGQLNIILVGLIGFVAAVVGDNVGFAIGHHGGCPLVERYGKYVLLTPRRLERADELFNRHGGKIVTVARFIEGLRQLNGIIAGITGMPWRRFLMFNALGAALWVGLWVTVGYLAGDHITAVYDTVQQYQLYFLIGVGLLLVAVVARHLVLRRQRSQQS